MGASNTAHGSTGVRYVPYIEELREFFASEGVHYGSPEDIVVLTERIEASQPFANDLSSMVRSIVFREGGEMPHSQLLEILAVAIGGAELNQAPQQYGQPLRKLLSFMSGVLRRPWNEPPDEVVASRHVNSTGGASHGHRGELVPFPTGPRPVSGRGHGQAAAISAAAERAAAHASSGTADTAKHPPAATPVQSESMDHDAPQPNPLAEPDKRRDVPDVVGEPTPPSRSTFDPHSPEDEAIEDTDFTEEGVNEADTSSAATQISPDLPAAAEPAGAAAIAAAAEQLSPPPAPIPARADAPSWQLAAEAARGLRHASPPETAVPPILPEVTHTPPTPLRPEHAGVELETSHAFEAASALPFRQTSPAPPLTGNVPSRGALDSEPAHSSSAPHLLRTPAGILVTGAALLVLAGIFAASFHRATELTGKQPAQPVAATVPEPASQKSAPARQESSAAAPATPTSPPQLVRVRRAAVDDEEDVDDRDVAPPYSTPIPGQTNLQKPSPYGTPVVQHPSSSVGSARPPANEIASTSSEPAGSVAASSAYPAESYAGGPSGLHPAAGSTYRSSEAASADLPRSGRGSREVASDRSGQIDVSSGTMAGYLISAPKPDYPTLARIAHIGGPVVLQAVIAKNGSVLATHVLSGHRLLRGAAEDAVRRWRFRPYVMDGHPVEVSTIVTVRFNSKH